MSYEVLWEEIAYRQLRSVRSRTIDPVLLRLAVKLSKTELQDDPEGCGEEYFGDFFIVMLNILWLLYRIDRANNQVLILQVGLNGIDLPHDDPPTDEDVHEFDRF